MYEAGPSGIALAAAAGFVDPRPPVEIEALSAAGGEARSDVSR